MEKVINSIKCLTVSVDLCILCPMSEPRWRLSKEHGLTIDGVMVCTPRMVCANGIIVENNPAGSSYLHLTIRMDEPIAVAHDVPFNIGALHPGMEKESLADLEPRRAQGH